MQSAQLLDVKALDAGGPDAPTSLGQRGTPVYALPEPAIRTVGHAAR